MTATNEAEARSADRDFFLDRLMMEPRLWGVRRYPELLRRVHVYQHYYGERFASGADVPWCSRMLVSRWGMCGKASSGMFDSVPFCPTHLSEQIETMLWVVEKSIQDFDNARIEAYQQRGPSREEFVYYMRRSDGAIKIGTSVQVEQRKRDLESAAGPLELLVVHSGGRKVERIMHHRFAFCRIECNREWFHPAEELLTHIESIRERRQAATR